MTGELLPAEPCYVWMDREHEQCQKQWDVPAGKGEIQISVFLVFFVDFLFVLSTGLNLCLLTSGKQGSSFF